MTTSNIPKPTGWHILICPLEPPDKTKGGIILADVTKETAHAASLVALVIDCGADAYADRVRYPGEAWCKPGDHVLIGRWAGRRFKVDGIEYRIMNEDDILATVPNPGAIGSVL